MNVYIVWELRNYTESSIILITDNESKAQEVSGRNKPSSKDFNYINENTLTVRFYGKMKLNKMYEKKTLIQEKGTTIYC